MTKDAKVYNGPNVSEVATLIVDEVDTVLPRGILMKNRSGKIQRINELHTNYLRFQYPLLFPYGEDGYRYDVNHYDNSGFNNKKRIRLTIRE